MAFAKDDIKVMDQVKLKSFCIKTNQSESFINELTELCDKFAENEDDYFFIYSVD